MTRRASLMLLLVGALAHGAETQQALDPEVTRLLVEAKSLLGRRRTAEGLEMIEKASKRGGPKCEACLFALADAYLLLGRDKDLADTARRLISLQPTEPSRAAAQNYLGLALSPGAKDNPSVAADAEGAFREALRIAGSRLPQVYFNLGILQLSLGKPDAGRESLETFLELEPQGDQAVRARRLLTETVCAVKTCAPEYFFVTLDGRLMDRDSLKGKVVLIYFWNPRASGVSWNPLSGSYTRTRTPESLVGSPWLVKTFRSLGEQTLTDPFVMVGIMGAPPAESLTPRTEGGALDLVDPGSVRSIERRIAPLEIDWTLSVDRGGYLHGAFGAGNATAVALIDHEGVMVRGVRQPSDADMATVAKAAKAAIARAKDAVSLTQPSEK
jgi:hypothetical protein